MGVAGRLLGPARWQARRRAWTNATGSHPGEGPLWPSPPLSHTQSPTGRSPGAGGGRRPSPRPGEAVGTPPGLDQCGSRTQEKAALLLSLSLPDPFPPLSLSLPLTPLLLLSLSLASLPGLNRAVPLLLSLSLAPFLLSLSPWPLSLSLACRAGPVSRIFRAQHGTTTVSCHVKPGPLPTSSLAALFFDATSMHLIYGLTMHPCHHICDTCQGPLSFMLCWPYARCTLAASKSNAVRLFLIILGWPT